MLARYSAHAAAHTLSLAPEPFLHILETSVLLRLPAVLSSRFDQLVVTVSGGAPKFTERTPISPEIR